MWWGLICAAAAACAYGVASVLQSVAVRSAGGGVWAGLAMLGLAADGEGSRPVGITFHFGLIVVTLVLAGLGVLAGRAPERLSNPALGLVAGLSFGMVALAGRVVSVSSLT